MIIAVDFDGTIVEHRYPSIGKERPFAFATLKKLQQEQHLLVLWSVREGRLLDEAVEYCRSHGVEFFAVNSTHPQDEAPQDSRVGRKLSVDLYIDDRNVGGLPDWGAIYQMIHNGWTYEQYLTESQGLPAPQKKHWWQR